MYPYVHVSISKYVCVCVCMQGWTSDPIAKAEIRGLVRETIDLFTPDRIMFASNYPVDKFTGTPYEDVYSTFAEFVSDLSEKEQHAMFYGTAEKIYFK
jgi:predicted TIM-barrel fold metal-dependent hydrolase